ncbi:class I SAM-dependent methyltransferase [Actinomadura vinacea]|uniref:Class I SAM-dependent methyltransferase n=1 Tax=Actinomadura vinacea TaxID=115336 RepID=A0ABN3K5X7_9ACTN
MTDVTDEVPPDHPDRLRWNAKYQDAQGPSFTAHPVAEQALSLPLPEGPVLDLACGPSGSALLAAGSGRRVTAVDVSEVALERLDREAGRRGLRDLITLVHADLGVWTPPPRAFALVLCTAFWDRRSFAPAAEAVLDGGVLGWEAFTSDARRDRPSLPAEWCLYPGEPATHLPGPFVLISQRNVPDEPNAPKRRLLARRGRVPGSGA